MGCITSSLVSWLMSLHPALVTPGIALYFLVFGSWAIAWVADDAVIKFLRIDPLDYSAILIGLAVAVLLGGIVTWLTTGVFTS